MKNNFELSFKFLIEELEKPVLTNDPKDPGGMTFAGISRVYHPTWPGWPQIDKYLSNTHLADHKAYKKHSWGVLYGKLAALVESFYKAEFWDRIKGDEMPSGVDSFLFIAGVHKGTAYALKLLQSSLISYEGEIDGKVGPKTLLALGADMRQSSDVLDLLDNLHTKLKYEYAKTAKPEYAKGFENRANKAYIFSKDLLTR